MLEILLSGVTVSWLLTTVIGSAVEGVTSSLVLAVLLTVVLPLISVVLTGGVVTVGVSTVGLTWFKLFTASSVDTATSTLGVVATASLTSFLTSSFFFFLSLLPVTINIIKAIKSNKTPPVISIPGIDVKKLKLKFANII